MIKNQEIQFFNTSKDTKTVVIDYELGGVPNKAIITLKPGEFFNEANVKVIIGRDANIIAIKSPDPKGNLVDLVPSRLATSQDILKASAVLDIETTELRAGAPITQIAVTSMEDKRSTLFIPRSQQFIATADSVEKSISFQHKLRAKGIKVPKGTSFRDLKYFETYMKMKGKSLESISEMDLEVFLGIKTKKGKKETLATKKGKIEDYLIKNDKFQAKLFVTDKAKLEKANISVDANKRILMDAILDGSLDEDQVMTYLRNNQGVLNLSEEISDFSLVKDRSLRDIVNTDLPALLEGKVTWIANANFESSQFGARIRSEAYRAMEAYNATKDPADQLDESKFMRKFNMGKLEQELDIVNKGLAPGEEPVYTKNPFPNVNPATGKPFDITGTGTFDTARARAFQTGDFSELYDAMLADTRVGDVRDPTDLARSLQSKLKNLGILDIEKPSALSVEVQARFAMAAREMRLAEEAGEELDMGRFIRALQSKETHIAIGDTVLSESPLVREYFDLLDSLRTLEAGGDEAKALMDQAKVGKGGAFRAMVVGGLQDYFNKATVGAGGERLSGLDDVLFEQRIGRTLMDIATKGSTEIRTAKPGLGVKERFVSQAGIDYSRKINTQSFLYQDVSTRGAVVDLLRQVPEYKSADKERYIQDMLESTKDFFDEKGNLIPAKRKALVAYAQPKTESAAAQIKVFADRLPGLQSGGGGEEFFNSIKSFAGMSDGGRSAPALTQGVASVPQSAAENMQQKLARATASAETSLRKSLGRGLLGAAILGVGFKIIDEASDNFKEKRSNYTLPDFEQFMKAQASFHGSKEAFLTHIREKYNVEGLQETGIMAEMRKLATDFGSPYQGMGYTTSVLDNFELRRERQKYEQAQFGARHFSVEGDVGFQLKRFIDTTFRKQMGYSKPTSKMFFGDFERISAGKYNSLRGDNIIEHRVNPADITIEDADTITIKRRGNKNNALSQFMGTGAQDSMSIRLAGIDAPETAHGDRSAQPYAEMAKQIATDLIRNAKDVRIVSRPDDTTYGRQVSMVYVDGKNLNLELVRRGAAAFLPYKGKGKPTFYNQKAFEEAEKQASEGNRGMWADPYFKAYQMVKSRSGQSITFNTLVNASKVAKSSQLMSVASLMEEASRAGEINDALAEELINLGETQKIAASGSKRSIYSPDMLRNNGMQADLSTFGEMGNSINSVLDQLKYEISHLQRTKGSKKTAETAKTRRVSSLNSSMAKDTLKAAQREYDFEQQNRIQRRQQERLTKEKRINDMQYMQQTALRNLFNSPIGHHRM